MNKKRFIILVAVIALLGAALYLLNTTDPVSPDTPEVVTTMEPIISEDATKIVRFEVKTEGEEYAIYKRQTDWVAQGREDIVLLSTRVDMLLEKASLMIPDMLVAENPEDLAQYGLSEPVRTTKVILEDGRSYTVFVGDLTFDELQRYVMVEGNPNVYLFSYSALNDYAPMFNNLRNMDVFSIYGVEYIDRVQIYDRDKNLTYEFAHQDKLTKEEQEMDYVRDTTINEWKMTKPFVATCLDDVIKPNMLDKFTTIWADDYIDDNPTDLAQYGLDNPQFVVTIKTTEGASKKLFVGNTVDRKDVLEASSKVYVKSSDAKNVYAIYKNYVEFLYTDMFTNLSQIPVISSIGRVRSMKIESGGKTFEFEVATNNYRLNGKELTYDEYREVYASIIGFSAHGVCTGKESINGEKIATASVLMTDGSQKTFEIVKYDDRNSVIVINGKPNFFVLNKQTDSMLEALNRFA